MLAREWPFVLLCGVVFGGWVLAMMVWVPVVVEAADAVTAVMFRWRAPRK